MKNKQNTAAVKHDHPGRPRYTMLFPKSLTFTFTALMAANGVDVRKNLGNGRENENYGKGDNATMLTIRKNLKYLLNRKQIFLMKGYTAVPDSDDGLGRRGLLYRHADTPFAKALAEAKIRGAEGLNEKAAPAPKATRKARTVKISAADKTASAKAIADAKAILAEPDSTVAIGSTPSTIPDAVHNPIVAPVSEATPAIVTAPEVSVTIANNPPSPAAAPEAAPVVPAETAPVAA